MNDSLMRKLLLGLTVLVLMIQWSHQYEAKAILLYHVNSNESVKIIDKRNRISYLNKHEDNSAIEFHSETSDLPKLYNLLFYNQDYMLVGTRERVLNITLSDLNADQALNDLDWKSRNIYRLECLETKLDSTEKILFTCHNYISAAIELNNSLITCGTNASIPFCRKYNSNTHELLYEFKQPQISALNRITSNNYLDAQQIPPFFEDESIYFVNSGSYTIEPTINKQVIYNDRFSTLIKTPKGALKNAKFRASFTHGQKAYFFFYETESVMDIKNGLTFKTPFSLIGEICKNDNGKGSYLENIKRFITFKKAVIYCYLPDYKDGFHVKYSEIQAVSKPISLSGDDSDVFYAIFTFRRLNSVDSALCQYKFATVRDTMTGYFKSMDHDDRIYYKKPLSTCEAYKEMTDSDLKRYYNERTQNYNFQMEQTVNEPALFALNNVKFTSIAVDSPNAQNNFNEVIFIGLEDGRVIKLLIRPIGLKKNNQKFQQPIIVQEFKLFTTTVNSLIIDSKSGKLIALSNEEIRSIDLDAGCTKNSECGGCLNTQDPYCAWSVHDSKCISLAHASQGENLIRISRHSQVSACNNISSNDVQYAIVENLENESTFYSELNAPKSVRGTDETDNLLVAIFLTALLTCLLSVGLTCLLINKRYKMADYLSRNLSTTLSSNRSTSSSTTSYNNYKTDKYMASRTDSKSKPRYQNFYQQSLKPLLDNSLFSKKNAQSTRYNPTVNTNVSSSSDCTQHSPNSELTQPKSINDTLSSSNESCCFDPQSLSDDCHIHQNCDRYTKRPYSSPIGSKKSSSNIDRIETIKTNTSLLSADASPDSNV